MLSSIFIFLALMCFRNSAAGCYGIDPALKRTWRVTDDSKLKIDYDFFSITNNYGDELYTYKCEDSHTTAGTNPAHYFILESEGSRWCVKINILLESHDVIIYSNHSIPDGVFIPEAKDYCVRNNTAYQLPVTIFIATDADYSSKPLQGHEGLYHATYTELDYIRCQYDESSTVKIEGNQLAIDTCYKPPYYVSGREPPIADVTLTALAMIDTPTKLGSHRTSANGLILKHEHEYYCARISSTPSADAIYLSIDYTQSADGRLYCQPEQSSDTAIDPDSKSNYVALALTAVDCKKCKNAVNCTQNLGSFTCHCKHTYMGELCDIKKTCSNNPWFCLNGGTCVDAGRYVDMHCVCPVGFSGSHCESELSCNDAGASCLNNGTCASQSSYDHTYICECVEGYLGKFCEIEKNCTEYGCGNGGKCVLGTGGYYCQCPKQFTGKWCKEERDCTNTPCQNAGTCNQTILGYYRCECGEHYTGEWCEVEHNCTVTPCFNGGTCVQREQGFQCECTANFTGRWCEIAESFNCSCLNGGTCVQDFNASRCECVPNFAGDFCQLQVNNAEDPSLAIESRVNGSVSFGHSTSEDITLMICYYAIIPLLAVTIALLCFCVLYNKIKESRRKSKWLAASCPVPLFYQKKPIYRSQPVLYRKEIPAVCKPDPAPTTIKVEPIRIVKPSSRSVGTDTVDCPQKPKKPEPKVAVKPSYRPIPQVPASQARYLYRCRDAATNTSQQPPVVEMPYTYDQGSTTCLLEDDYLMDKTRPLGMFSESWEGGCEECGAPNGAVEEDYCAPFESHYIVHSCNQICEHC